jgi:hypothetical protein
MPFNHEAVAALPVLTLADKAAIRAMSTRRFVYVLTAAESSLNFVAVDPDTGVIPQVLFQGGSLFAYDSADSTTTHDGITCLVSSDGKRFKTTDFAAFISLLTKASVGLGNVDNTSDANKPVPTAQATALALKLNSAGTITNDSAAAGNIGEIIQSIMTTGSAVALTSGTQINVTSISLTAGDWDVNGIVYHWPAATTSYTRYVGSISTTTGAIDSNPGKFADFSQAAFVSGGLTFNDAIPPYRFSLATTTTVYLVALGSFTVSTASAYGILRARRVR